MNKEQMLASVNYYISQFARTKKEKAIVQNIVNSMEIIDRKFFVPEGIDTYADTAQSIGKGQTISQPSTVARMLMLAELGKGDNVLEVGIGSGWNASLISYLVYLGSVTAVERISTLTKNAKENIKKLKKSLSATQKKRLSKLELITEDALNKKSLVWKKKYDRIIITAGIADKEIEDTMREMAYKLLNSGGVLVCPYTHGPIILYRKNKKLEKFETSEYYVFVPLLRYIE